MDRTLDDQELERLCRLSLKSAEDKIKVFKNHGVKILELNMVDPIMDNAQKVYDFIHELK